MSLHSPREELQLPAGERNIYHGVECDNYIDNIYRNGQESPLRKSNIILPSTINFHGVMQYTKGAPHL